jgi:GH24 family phage-related lysozyme (muramidase)
MKASDKCIELIKKFEGCRLKAYRDPAGVLTIGYGHTRNVTLGQTITEERALQYLRDDLVKAQTEVSKYNTIYKWNQNEFDALVSFVFNIGSLSGLTKFGTRSKEEIASKMLLYVNAGGKKLEGLVKRRKAEHDLFVTPVPNLSPTYETGTKHKVIVSGLRLRKEASTSAPEIRKLKKGTNYLVKGSKLDTEGNIWVKIAEGYAAAIYRGKKYID